LKTRGRTEANLQLARSMLEGAMARLSGDGLGLLNELFDGDSPHRAGGAIGCAPATGELLRCWAEDILAVSPQRAQAGIANPAGESARVSP